MIDGLPDRIGPHRIDGVLGRGASGVVYRGYDEALDRPVAVKLLTDDLDPEARQRFEIEAKAAARIVHPNVVQVFGAGTHEDDAYITLELVEGVPLSAVLDAKETLSWGAAIDVALQVAEGLAAAEACGVLHRDIKPHNLLVTDSGLVKIADFGLAKILDAPSSLTESGTTLGTPHYMSPEQGQGKARDARSDQYALGATLYHLLTGAPPFDADTAVATIFLHASEAVPPLCERAPECPAALAEIVERMLAKAPEDRFEDFDQLLDALSALSADEPADLAQIVAAAAVPQPEPMPVARSGARDRVALVAMAVLAIAVIAAATHSAESRTSEVAPRRPIAAPAIPVSTFDPQRDPFDPPPEPPVAEKPKKAEKKRSTPKGAFARNVQNLTRGGSTAVRAARSLAEQNDQRATPALIRALASNDARVAKAAAEALGELGDIRAIEPLAKAATESRSEDVRAAAEAARQRLWHVEER